MPVNYDRGRCSVCSKLVALKKDGTLRHHLNTKAPRYAFSRFASRCEGAGTKPAEAR